MMSHTLIIMHWQIELSSSQDKRGLSCQCGDWCPLVSSKGPGYQYNWDHMVVYIQTHQWNESIAWKYRWTSCSSAQWMTERRTSALPTVQWPALHADSCHRAGSRLTCQLSMNSWMDFFSCHYLCVKFSLRLMHNIHSLIHVEKSTLKGYFQPIKAKKNWFRKNINNFFCSISWDNAYLQ